jgi:hypothetical protein
MPIYLKKNLSKKSIFIRGRLINKANLIRHRIKAAILFFFLSFAVLSASGQTASIVDKIDRYNGNLPGERMYLQFDKPYYAVGDTIWFKGYITGNVLSYSPLSSRVYVDLVNDSNKVIQHLVFPVSLGLTTGNIYLDEKQVHEGAYTLRAYTSWMRSLGNDQFFYHNFYIAGAGDDHTLLINSGATLTGSHVKVDLNFSGVKNQPIGIRELQLKLTDDKKILTRGSAQTGADGSMRLDFDLPDNSPVKNLTLVTLDKKNNRTETIPLHLTRPQDADVQFMPESGPLVESLPAHVGFKAIGEDGRGIDIKGVLVDKEQNEEVSFASLRKGMGVFDFTPQPGESYTARITLTTGAIKILPLPEIKSTGTVLRIKSSRPDSLEMAVLASSDLTNGNSDYTIIGQTRGQVYYAATIRLNKAYLRLYVPKRLFPTGVAHFTLFNAQNQPVNERSVFIDHEDQLKVAISAAQQAYAPRDSVPMCISVKDNQGKPVVGSFSLSVTDDGQVKQGDEGNIFTGLLLGSDLKGYIEEPGWYFTSGGEGVKALDVLLLTQGWVGYSWKDIFNLQPVQAAFAAEPEYAIKGRVGNLLNKPIANAQVTLVSTGKVKLYKDTVTNSDGQFMFRNFPQIPDSTNFVLEARKNKGRIINAGISVDESSLTVPEVVLPFYPIPAPWYVNSDNNMLSYVKNSVGNHHRPDNANLGGDHLLKTVTITGKTIVRNSKNLNGPGESDQAVGQEEIEKLGKISLLQLIEQRIKGFREDNLVIHPSGKSAVFVKMFFLNDKKVQFIIDGVNLDEFFSGFGDGSIPSALYDYYRETLDYFSAEDIVGIELMYNMKYNARYSSRYIHGVMPPWLKTPAYLEITTRSGKGPFDKKANGIYVYKPVPVALPAQFYSPKYPVKNNHTGLTDMRSTIHWEPNIITDRKGEASVYFYAADPLTTYTITLQGTDLKGSVGYITQKLVIKNP